MQLKRLGGSVFDLILEERVGHVQAMMGNRVTFTQGTGKIPKAGECRTCRKMAGGSVWLEPKACEEQ